MRSFVTTMVIASALLAGCVGPFLVVDGHREKVLGRISLLDHDGSHEYDCIIHFDYNGPGSLTCDFAALQRYRMVAVLKCFLDCCWYHVDSSRCLVVVCICISIFYLRRPRLEIRSL